MIAAVTPRKSAGRQRGVGTSNEEWVVTVGADRRWVQQRSTPVVAVSKSKRRVGTLEMSKGIDAPSSERPPRVSAGNGEQ